MKSIELMKSPKNISLIVIMKDDNSIIEYVVARDYDKHKPFGEQWYSGNYLPTLPLALGIYNARNGYMTKSRLEEIASHALHYMNENDTLEDFLYNYDIDLEEEEIEYFGLNESEE